MGEDQPKKQEKKSFEVFLVKLSKKLLFLRFKLHLLPPLYVFNFDLAILDLIEFKISRSKKMFFNLVLNSFLN